MMKKNKIFKPLKKAIYTIQFHRNNGQNADKTLNFAETANKGTLYNNDPFWCDLDNMEMFGRCCEESKLLDEKDKVAISYFCIGYLKKYFGTLQEEDIWNFLNNLKGKRS